MLEKNLHKVLLHDFSKDGAIAYRLLLPRSFSLPFLKVGIILVLSISPFPVAMILTVTDSSFIHIEQHCFSLLGECHPFQWMYVQLFLEYVAFSKQSLNPKFGPLTSFPNHAGECRDVGAGFACEYATKIH